MTDSRVQGLESDIIGKLLRTKHPAFVAERDASLRKLLRRQYAARRYANVRNYFISTKTRIVLLVCTCLFVLCFISFWAWYVYYSVDSNPHSTTIWSLVVITLGCIALPIVLVYLWRRFITEEESSLKWILTQLYSAVFFVIGMSRPESTLFDYVQNKDKDEYESFLKRVVEDISKNT